MSRGGRRRRSAYKHCNDNMSAEVTTRCRESPVNSVAFTFIHEAAVCVKPGIMHSIWSKRTPLSGPWFLSVGVSFSDLLPQFLLPSCRRQSTSLYWSSAPQSILFWGGIVVADKTATILCFELFFNELAVRSVPLFLSYTSWLALLWGFFLVMCWTPPYPEETYRVCWSSLSCLAEFRNKMQEWGPLIFVSSSNQFSKVNLQNHEKSFKSFTVLVVFLKGLDRTFYSLMGIFF